MATITTEARRPTLGTLIIGNGLRVLALGLIALAVALIIRFELGVNVIDVRTHSLLVLDLYHQASRLVGYVGVTVFAFGAVATTAYMMAKLMISWRPFDVLRSIPPEFSMAANFGFLHAFGVLGSQMWPSNFDAGLLITATLMAVSSLFMWLLASHHNDEARARRYMAICWIVPVGLIVHYVAFMLDIFVWKMMGYISF